VKAKVNGIQLYFDVEGAGLVPVGNRMVEKPAMFALHGGPGFDHSMYKPSLSSLADILQIIYVDHRGNGRSERLKPEEYTLANTVEDLEALRKYLGLGKVIVLGGSYGGVVALSYATTYPDSVSRLIIECTAPSYEWFEEGRQEAYRRATPEMKPELDLLFEGRYESAEQMKGSFKIFRSIYFQKDYELYRDGAEEALDRAILSPQAINWGFAVEISKRYDVRDKLSRITAPTLILAGRHDWAMHPHQQELMHERIPNSQLVWFEHCGHVFSSEEPHATLQLMREFLSDIVDEVCEITRVS
jgi:proline iminopeptidase